MLTETSQNGRFLTFSAVSMPHVSSQPESQSALGVPVESHSGQAASPFCLEANEDSHLHKLLLRQDRQEIKGHKKGKDSPALHQVSFTFLTD